jgi:hypothetical protein
MSNNQNKFPVNKLIDSGGRKTKKMISVIKNIKGKLAPV